eukprot:CAMPEP_0183709706 /NCGR_PEP_ID=MMETSP0737-20130205/5694_1 /TAXON_ID=385413 /ORGANISM="Thalassiosira miniscula, Strain CCMP1093" /LENGTH=1745 /DNA_ID=CAMNT_0025937873 /DNA_START=28 /DNA_END=5265 /DNA_ORIENTATION=+
MDLPPEDKTAQAKRRAIQALMKNKSLTPAQRHKEMQEIMKGNFPMDDDDSDGSSEYESESDEESSASGSYSEEEDYSRSSRTRSRYDDDSSSSGSGSEGNTRQGSLDISEMDASTRSGSSGGESYSEEETESDYSSQPSQQSSRQSQQSHYSSQSVRTEEGSEASQASHGNGSHQPNSPSGSRQSYGRRQSEVSVMSSRSVASGASTSSVASSAQKDKQKALLEISRDKSLSAEQRQAKMKEIMQTSVKGFSQSSGGGGGEDQNNGSPNDNNKPTSTASGRVMPLRSASGRQLRRNSRRTTDHFMQDSVTECKVDEDHGIQPLRMSRRRVTENVKEIKNITESIASNDARLTKIELQKMNLTDEDVIPLLDALGTNEHVTSLNLRRNRIGIEGCSTLASAILDNRTLVCIDVSGNNLGDEGMEDLSKVIPYNKSLITLNIEDNKIGDEGATAFAESLMENATLAEINLSGNLIGDRGAGDLFKVLGSANGTVTSLQLRFNAISDEGATELASALLDNETLQLVDLSNNNITNAGAKDLMKVVSINDTLEVLELGGNVGIDEDMLEEIQRALEEEADESEEDSDSDSEGSSESEYSEEESALVEEEESEESGSEDEDENDNAPTGGEAMLQDMPDEDNAQLAKRKLIQQIMQDKSLSGIQKNKKIQDVMAGKIALPKVEPKPKAKPKPAKAESKPKPKPQAARARPKPPESESESESESEREEIEGSIEPPKAPAAAASSESAELTGGEAMLQDMPDETNAALSKRKLIQSVMQDRSLSPVERNKKIQDIMAGRIELPKVEPKKESPPPAQPAENKAGGGGRGGGGGNRRRGPSRRPPKEEESDSSKESKASTRNSEDDTATSASPASPAAASSNEDGGELTGGEAMLQDMPDETNAALAKRKMIQSVMQDRSLSAVDRNKKIQDVMAGRVELPKVEPKKAPPVTMAAAKPVANQTRRTQEEEDESDSEESYSESDDEEDGSSVYSESESESSGSQGGSSASSSEQDSSANDVGEGASDAAEGGDGANAMLRDMPDESDTQLAKRFAIQGVMKDKSLNPQERTKMIQDIMAGKVKLQPPPQKSKPPSPAPSPPKKAAKSAPPPNNERRSKKQQNRAKDDNDSEPMPKTQQEERKPKLNSNGAVNGKLPTTQVNKKANVTSSSRSPNGTSPRSRENSYDGGARTAVAHEWKLRMMATHPRSHDNLLDILLAHQYRLSLKFPPSQSFFRVVAVVFFARIVDGVRRSERYHVVGTNDEPHSVGGSICAERAALMQLRFIPDLECITKIVIVTDEADAISPGMLCREFMASHDRIPWSVPIVLGRSICRKCGFTVSGNVCGDANGCFQEESVADKCSDLFDTCTKGQEEKKNDEYDTPHDFIGTITTLRELFPYPSLYTRMTSKEAQIFGENHLEKELLKSKSKGKDLRAHLANGNRRHGDDSNVASYRQEKFDLTMLSNIMEENEGDQLSSSGTQKFDDSSKRSNQSNLNNRRQSSTSRVRSSVKSSMSHSLKATINFMKELREDSGLGLDMNRSDTGLLDHLTARTLRISNRLKPSQRRQKLIRLATEVTAMETNHSLSNIHPIRYGAAVLFSDSTVAIAAQKVALEYGCTLDAVGQLASVIDRKAIQIEEDAEPCRPILLVQCDQFGIAHAPFAQGRAFLTERGYGDCKILVHQRRQKNGLSSAEFEMSLQSIGDDGSVNSRKADSDLRLLEVGANDLAPAPPDIFGGLMTKNHSQQQGGVGLQIQF